MRKRNSWPAWLSVLAIFTLQTVLLPATQIRSLCEKHLALESNPWPGVLFSAAPADAVREAQVPHSSNVQIYYQLPITDADYRKLFGAEHTISAQTREEIQQVKTSLKVNGLQDAHRELTADNFGDVLKRTTAAYVLIVGHNQEGRFAFLNGSDKALDDLANDCAASGKICIFISCRSRKYIHAG